MKNMHIPIFIELGADLFDIKDIKPATMESKNKNESHITGALSGKIICAIKSTRLCRRVDFCLFGSGLKDGFHAAEGHVAVQFGYGFIGGMHGQQGNTGINNIGT